MRKIIYISGTRADFGLMEESLKKIHLHPNLSLGVIVTGMHLIKEYGDTWQEIENSDLHIIAKVPVSLSGSSNLEMACAVGEKIVAFSRILEKEQPDLLLLLGDRGEMLAGAIAALHLNIPIVHIHGGERSGTIDESIRHAVSKFAHYHLVTTENSRERLIRMGERQDNICVTGAPGLDSIVRLKVAEKGPLFNRYSLNSGMPLVLILFHPVVQQTGSLSSQVNNLLSVVLELDIQVLMLMPNSDAGGRLIKEEITKFQSHKNLKTVVHVPRNDFLSLVFYAEVLVGNSSCGIIESASLATPVLNVGTRQKFRERNPNVVDAGTSKTEIRQGLGKAMDLRGQDWSNVYGNGCASDNIVRFLDDLTIDKAILEKVNAY
ncbi:UDP-N-acetylglucosamine 2-epimerase [Endozoicomonas ascidiicola]|uniref:UDP-N-acetylglucosamine 2-epimerase n=1 Tax=Endozoicomonas ascidiicola TaxID=1698521 RepID=UPI000AEEF10D|nr:UDP-N-acetylglucosamine 2-epimerase [Endozoicomonas ascidiicola]